MILFNVKEPEQQEEKPETTQAEVMQNPETMTQTAESIEDKYKVFGTMSEDWGSDDLEGFVFYDLPEKYADKGYFPEKMQIYTRCLCKQNDVPYALVLAIIEYESGYEFDKTGDNGNSKGYMQIYEKWHTDRMQKLNCTDLMNPYQNVKVGIDFLSYLLKKYGTVQDALAAYNYGERGAREHLWNNGVYVYSYNTAIMQRMPTKTKFKTRSNAQGTEIKSHAYRALRRSRLKEMHAVRYADDFKIFCATHEDAVRAYKATELWLKDRLGLEISPDKSKVVNLKRQNSDFLGFKLKVRKKDKKYVVRSHMSDKAYKKAHEKVSEEVKKLAHSSDDNAQFMQLQKYNSVVAGLHEYYCISTEVSHDFSRLAFSINKQLRNRLKGDLSKKGQLRNGFIKEKYGASRQMRFLHGRPVVPLGYVQSKNAQHKRKSINKYTVKGREQIHKNLAIDTATMLWLIRNPVKGRTIEYADNRISLYAAQYGKCAVTGIPMDSHDIHCHHKVPVSNGGSDEYANLILVSKAVHILIHASSELTIEKYLKSLNLDNKQIEKLNKLRIMAEMPPIIL